MPSAQFNDLKEASVYITGGGSGIGSTAYPATGAGMPSPPEGLKLTLKENIEIDSALTIATNGFKLHIDVRDGTAYPRQQDLDPTTTTTHRTVRRPINPPAPPPALGLSREVGTR